MSSCKNFVVLVLEKGINKIVAALISSIFWKQFLLKLDLGFLANQDGVSTKSTTHLWKMRPNMRKTHFYKSTMSLPVFLLIVWWLVLHVACGDVCGVSDMWWCMWCIWHMAPFASWIFAVNSVAEPQYYEDTWLHRWVLHGGKQWYML